MSRGTRQTQQLQSLNHQKPNVVRRTIDFFIMQAGNAVRDNISIEAGDNLQTSIEKLINFLQIVIELAAKDQLRNLRETVNKGTSRAMSFLGIKKTSPNTKKIHEMEEAINKLQNDFNTFKKSGEMDRNSAIEGSKTFYNQAIYHLTELLSVHYELSDLNK